MDLTPDGAIGALKARGLDSLPPVAIVLGSGLGAFADEARDSTAISYLDIPGFPIPTVEGHAGRLVVGVIEGERVALFQGRGHYYERGDAKAMRIAIETFRKLGGETLLLTNAVTLKCPWTVAAHSTFAIEDGLPESDVRAIRAGKLPRDPKYAALSALTKTLIENRGKASEADIERFVSAGYSKAQIFEVVLGAGISMTTATATNMAGTPIEDHFKAQTWAAA